MPTPISVGLIGCGSFAKAVHIPNLLANSKYRIHAAMDVDENAAREVARLTGASYATTDLDRLLLDPEVKMVFITTRHDSHAPLSIRAGRAGKHILCEKPMGLSEQECRQVASAVERAGVLYTVGYNRGLALLIVEARHLLTTLPQKRLIYHRLQAPFPEHLWTHDPKVGGGRFIGEGCHIFDLLCELVPAPPVSVYAAGGIFLDPLRVKTPDSGVVTLGFADGSVGTTLIASAGCGSFPKESTEIYCAGKAILISDFKEMETHGFGDGGRQVKTLEKQDKGQAGEIDLLADAILGDGEAPNGPGKAARAALVSLKVVQSIATGLPVAISEAEFQPGPNRSSGDLKPGARDGELLVKVAMG